MAPLRSPTVRSAKKNRSQVFKQRGSNSREFAPFRPKCSKRRSKRTQHTPWLFQYRGERGPAAVRFNEDDTLEARNNIPDDSSGRENRYELLFQALVAMIQENDLFQAQRVLEQIVAFELQEKESLEVVSLETLKKALHVYQNLHVELVMRDCGLSEMKNDEIARFVGCDVRTVQRRTLEIKAQRKKRRQICRRRS